METKIKLVREWDEQGRPVWTERETYKFSDEDKVGIVSEYIQSGCSANEIIKKYHISSRVTFLNWVDRYAFEEKLVSLPSEPIEGDMAKKDPEQLIKELQSENRRLQKALALEQLRSKAYDTMIDLAEKQFNIPVRKKSGTKQ